jgi:thiosulfate reductase/polysulfide reductase chain A
MSVSIKTVCSHCSVKCGVIVELEDGLPVRIKGDPSHPMSKGFMCVRGQAAIEYFNHPGRLNHALKRAGARGEDRWHEVPLDEAIQEIADRLKASTDHFGRESLAHFFGTYHGTDQGIGVRFMNLFGSPNYVGNAFICAGPKIQSDWLTFGFGPATPDPQPGITRAIIVWSQRVSASHAPNWGRYLATKRAGAKLVVIDPVKTPEAKAADLWLPIRPGTDAALALGLINVVIDQALYDASFVAQHTSGFAELAARAAQYPLDRVSRITGLAIDDIVACARIYADGPSIISTGLVNGMGRNALNFERARACLVAISGNIDRPGGNRLFGSPDRTLTKTDIELYGRLSDEQKAKRIGASQFRLHGAGYDRINEVARKRWRGHEYLLTASRGALAHAPSVFRAILDAKPYPIRSLIVQHANPIGSYSNVPLVREAFRSSNLDLIVVHELFKTATTTYADFILPSAAWLEKPWMYVSGENQQVMATQRPVQPQFDRLTDYDFFRELGRAFGQDDFWPASLEGLFSEMLAPAGVTFDELSGRTQNWFIDKADDDGVPRTAYGTHTGKIELASSVLRECEYDPLPDFVQESWPETTSDYPLRLSSGATDIKMTHQDHRQIASLRQRHPNPTARLNPVTAAELDLKAGDWVWLIAEQGRVLQQVEVSAATPANSVDAERWWYPERKGDDANLYDVLISNVNVLTRDDPSLCDSAYGTWPLRLGRCRIEKASIAAAADDGLPAEDGLAVHENY